MPMHIKASWGEPVCLEPGDGQFIYMCPNLESIPKQPGAYVIGRWHGKNMIPIYVGKSINLHSRLRTYLTRPKQKRMTAVSLQPKGKRFFICCTVEAQTRQSTAAVLTILEDALMKHALANGYSLINVHGNRRKDHEIHFTGNQVPESIGGKVIRLPVS